MFEGLEEQLRLVHTPNQIEPWMELQYTEAESIHRFIELVNALNNISHLNAYKQPIFFRGQADSKWRLEPKIYRLLKSLKIEEALRIEFDSIRYFKQQARVFLSSQLIPEDDNIGAWLALMQQYGAPTRMLDWTTSFNVALYFAVTDEPFDRPGAVWFFGVGELLKWMHKYDDLPDSKLADILSDEEKFVAFGANKAPPKIHTYDISIKSERMVAQQSIFTYCEQLFCDHVDLIGPALWDCIKNDRKTFPLSKIVISPSAKRELRLHLSKLNISAATLFPGADGVGRTISEIIRVQCDVFHRPNP